MDRGKPRAAQPVRLHRPQGTRLARLGSVLRRPSRAIGRGTLIRQPLCSISGELRFNTDMADVRARAAGVNAPSRSGPYGAGIFSLGRRCFGHRRLSIMGFTPRAHQRFVDNTLGLGIAFNGAI